MKYKIIRELMASEEVEMTFEEANEICPVFEGWKTWLEVYPDELRLYAEREDSEDRKPTRYDDWRESSAPDTFWIVVGIEESKTPDLSRRLSG